MLRYLEAHVHWVHNLGKSVWEQTACPTQLDLVIVIDKERVKQRGPPPNSRGLRRCDLNTFQYGGNRVLNRVPFPKNIGAVLDRNRLRYVRKHIGGGHMSMRQYEYAV